MNKSLRPILARLTALASPARLAPDGARVIADPSHPNPLAALLRELNETILAREMMLLSGSGSSMTLDVAGRRVLRLAAATGLGGTERCLAAGTLEDDHKDDLLALLQAMAAPQHELRVTSRPLAAAGEGLSVGLPVALLADLLLVELNEAPQAAPVAAPVTRPSAPVIPISVAQAPDAPPLLRAIDLERFSAAMGAALVAWVIRNGSENGASGGAEEMLVPLRAFLADEAEAVVAQLDRVSSQPGSPICLVLGASLIDGHSVICVGSGSGQLLGVIEGDATQRLLQAWADARV